MTDQNALMQEIQTLKAKVEELDNVIANLPGHVYWLDRNNIYLGCNDIQAKNLSFNSRKDIVGKTNLEIVPSIAENLDSINRQVMESNTPFLGEEYSNFENIKKFYLSQKVPLLDDKGYVIGLLGVSFDITDRKQMEKDLKEAKEKAEIASQTKTEFIRNMEHDIRTPLCGIMSVVAHLCKLEQDLQKREFLNDVEVATNELLNYLDNIIEFSQINTDSMPIIKKEFNLEHILRGIVNIELPAAKSKSLDLIVEYPSFVPRILFGDKFRLHRVLLNLVSNAIKFTQNGFVKISVDLTEETKSDDCILLKIEIADTGIGIDKKNHELIFDKFTRCDPSNKGLFKGSGLGLWIVKHFIEDLNGHIELESSLGNGSVFTCHIPFELTD